MTIQFVAEGWIAYGKAAQMLGVSRQTIYNYAAQGRLKTIIVVGETHYVSLAEVEELASKKKQAT